MKFSATALLLAMRRVGAFAPSPARFYRTACALNIAVGDSLPAVELFQGFPDVEKVDAAKYAKGKNMVVVPGYLENEAKLKDAGIDEVLVYCVNDPAVMQAWSEDQGTDDTEFVSMFGDPAAEFTDALDLRMTDAGPPSVGIIGRSKRFALIVQDGTVKHVAVSEGEGDPAGDSDPSASLADAMLAAIEGGALK